DHKCDCRWHARERRSHKASIRPSSRQFYRLQHILLSRIRRPESSTLFPYTTLFRSISQRITQMPQRTGLVVVLHLQIGNRRVERSEEHTSELQSRENLVCRLLLEKKKNR